MIPALLSMEAFIIIRDLWKNSNRSAGLGTLAALLPRKYVWHSCHFLFNFVRKYTVPQNHLF